MTLLPHKPPKKRPPNATIAFRPPDDQADWIEGRLQSGWKQADLMTEVVGMHLYLDRAMEPHMDAVRAFAKKEGLEPRSEGDTLWLREAMARLMVRGLEAEQGKPAKKGGK
ncbi:hypothetical protein JY651_28560 [Pyxidicoccus parkwayensis]|uniref:Uncharacterized protein n=1 Tax=Pyxidicoccus parkwayensis TaxID=2813578 RepID=A0ABX7NP03_9BACT|nr:hypothetical protein [Pyxidicoccus parkwaysis]QSQ19285.1 hypothetical protein JY651_28560 [Pyxidicoccus parkwaysis]